MGHDDQRLRDMEGPSSNGHAARCADPLRLLSVPESGESLRVGRLSVSMLSPAFPGARRSCPLAASSRARRHRRGNATGLRARKSGNAPLTGGLLGSGRSFSPGQSRWPRSLTQLEHKHGRAQPGPSGATTARTVSDRGQRHTACEMGKCLHGSGRGADEPHASLDTHGRSLRIVLCHVVHCVIERGGAQRPLCLALRL